MRSKEITNVNQILSFILAGKSIFTLVSNNTMRRFTYKVTQHKKDKGVYFVELLNGPDNNNSYTFIGTIFKNETNIVFKHSAKSIINKIATSIKAIQFCLNNYYFQNKNLNEVTFYHMGRCGKCGRVLTVPESINNGIGPECIKFL